MLTTLLQEAAALPPVSADAARAYKAAGEAMVDFVNRLMTGLPQIHQLIGYNPFSLMFDNHLNHARFMANVFRFQAMDLLVKTIPWVYRTYHQHGFRYEYFPAELAAWQKAVSLYIDSSLNLPILRVYQWMLDRHADMVRLSQEPVEVKNNLQPAYAQQRREFLQALLQGDSRTCQQIGDKLTRTPVGLETFYLEIIQPCMYEVGRLWEAGEISVAQEHLATAVVARLMAVLYPTLELVQEPKGHAVVTAAANEYHETGARCVADLLALNGWQIYYLGANTPTLELISYLEQTRPHLLALSVAVPFNLDNAADAITAIRENPHLDGLKIMVGGQAFSQMPELWQLTGADGYGADARAAVELASSWW